MTLETYLALNQLPPRSAGVGKSLIRRGLFAQRMVLVGFILSLAGLIEHHAPIELLFWAAAGAFVGAGYLWAKARRQRVYREGRIFVARVDQRWSRWLQQYAYDLSYSRDGGPAGARALTARIPPVAVGSEVRLLVADDGAMAVALGDGLFMATERKVH